jgi:hypothetical protein
LACPHEQGLRKNNRVENSHQAVRRRERKMQRSNRPGLRSSSLASMPPSTTRSIFNATSSSDRHCAPSERKRGRNGRRPSSLHNPNCSSPALRPSLVTVTRPYSRLRHAGPPREQLLRRLHPLGPLRLRPSRHVT